MSVELETALLGKLPHGWGRVAGGFRHDHGWYLLAGAGGFRVEIQKGEDDYAFVDACMIADLMKGPPEKSARDYALPSLEVVMGVLLGFARITGCKATIHLERPDSNGWGSIERELRGCRDVLSGGAEGAHRVWASARAELKRRGMKDPGREDIASEAIEAAGALGL